MIPSAVRMGVLLSVPAVCAVIHYVVATRLPHRATHFVVPATQSAVANPDLANKASISMDDLQRLVAGGLQEVILIDARHPALFAEGHVPGAKNFHVDAVENDVSIIVNQIDQMTDVVLYCATKACHDSARLFDILTQLLEYPNVRLFRGGIDAWTAAKLPIEKGPSR